jgi:cupin 2 domain-containing protein
VNNIFDNIPGQLPDEFIDILVQQPGIRIERIVSRGHATPPGQWYDQESDEWVMLLSGSAGLHIEGREAVLELNPGDYVLLRAHQKHRVEWTRQNVDTLWLAIHF